MPRAERPDMAAYGVPDDLDGVLPWSWAEERLLASRNFWLATASSDARPHLMPVWALWRPEQEDLVFSCATESRKASNLRANPQVVFTNDDSVEVVSIEGRATEFQLAEQDDLLQRYAAKYESDPAKQASLATFLAGTCGFRVTPERGFGIIERPDEFAATATRWVW